MSSLDDWQQTVSAFGGRIGPPDAMQLWQALEASNLGSSKLINTTANPAIFEPVISLAEINLPIPISVDVSFAYLNRMAQSGPGGFTDSGLAVGDGFVRVTWGVPGGIKNTADIDGAYGWRFPFVASFLRVDYVPNGQVANVPNSEWIIPGGQVRDLGVSAMIAPASGAPCAPLTKTVFFPFVDQNNFAVFGLVPRWAKSYMVGGDAPPGSSFVIQIAEGGPAPAGAVLQEIFSNGLAGSYPDWVTKKGGPVAIPQGSQFFFIFPNVGTSLNRFTVICELAL